MEREKKILDSRYAVSFTLRFFIIVFVIFSLSGLILIIFLNRNIGPTYKQGISSLNTLQAQLPSILFLSAFIQATILCIIALLLSLLWAHSVAGPLMRFRKYLREAGKGKLPLQPLTFRKTDQLHGLGRALSEMIDIYKQRRDKALALLNQTQDKEEKEVYLQIKEIYSPKNPGQ